MWSCSVIAVVLGIVCVLITTGCTSTTMIGSRKLSGTSVNLDDLTKVMVVARTKDESLRKVAEDRVASLRKSFRASYTEFTNKEIVGDENKLKKILKYKGYDGVVTIRFLGEAKETRYVQGARVPGTYIVGPVGRPVAYNSGYYLPGYYLEDTKNRIQVDVFYLGKDQLLWLGVTETTNPTGADMTLAEVLDEVRTQMIKDKFIAPR